MRNLGLSGMNSRKRRAELRLGTEQSATNSLQLWKSSVPREKCAQLLGITSQARPADGKQPAVSRAPPAEDLPPLAPKGGSHNMMFPAIQKVARALIMAPLLSRGMNSEK
ncbi:hypothetical protein EYF80_009896 [Liparis tanakae]|uniref:Uncharacterized protein n=1 Tax=Liparis tanakae TaxID=230148 RepID=A0A4Z2IPB4_9TELE|nr:hypothetical protein EYF80_009896 [Liparis tanakae]